jgi:hypothetical protein
MLKQVLDFSFVGGRNAINLTSPGSAFFTGPFITIDGVGSNHYARKRLIEVIKPARHRLLVCS